MGKRKSGAKPPPKKQRPKLDISFNCPFCNSAKSVTCLFDMEVNKGTAKCCKCQKNYSMPVDHLTEPIDVYSAWIDKCEELNQ